MELVKRTAQTNGAGPNTATGYGVIDPVAALTYQLPPAEKLPNPDVGRPISAPLRRHRDDRVRNIVLSVTGGCVALSIIALAVSAPNRLRKMQCEIRGGGSDSIAEAADSDVLTGDIHR